MIPRPPPSPGLQAGSAQWGLRLDPGLRSGPAQEVGDRGRTCQPARLTRWDSVHWLTQVEVRCARVCVHPQCTQYLIFLSSTALAPTAGLPQRLSALWAIVQIGFLWGKIVEISCSAILMVSLLCLVIFC